VALIDIKRDKIWERQTNTYTLKCLEVCKKKFFTIISVIYILLKLAVFHRCTFFLWVIVEGAILVFLYHEASRRYQSIRLMSFSLRYEYQTKVFDLVITIFIIAHCIVVLLLLRPSSYSWRPKRALSPTGLQRWARPTEWCATSTPSTSPPRPSSQ
jgi:hypothetical protein